MSVGGRCALPPRIMGKNPPWTFGPNFSSMYHAPLLRGRPDELKCAGILRNGRALPPSLRGPSRADPSMHRYAWRAETQTDRGPEEVQRPLHRRLTKSGTHSSGNYTKILRIPYRQLTCRWSRTRRFGNLHTMKREFSGEGSGGPRPFSLQNSR